jgi:molybdopterin-guanine dinucleotide biosynthesis protein A
MEELWRENELVKAAGFLLCGGRSSRMGRDKALLLLDGELLVQRGLRTLGAVCAEVAIAGGVEDLSRFGKVIPDDVAECGPLGGIVSAMEQSSSEWNLFLSVDSPFVPVAALKRLLLIAAGSSLVCVMAQAAGVLQPLCAVYSRKALPILREELEAGRWKVTQAIAAAGECKMVDFEEESWFRNLNTPEEFADAERHGGA